MNQANNSGTLTLSGVVQTPEQAINLLSEAAKRAAPTWGTLADSGRCLYAAEFIRTFLANAEKTVADLNKQLAECHAKMAKMDPAKDLKERLADSDPKEAEAGALPEKQNWGAAGEEGTDGQKEAVRRQAGPVATTT